MMSLRYNEQDNYIRFYTGNLLSKEIRPKWYVSLQGWKHGTYDYIKRKEAQIRSYNKLVHKDNELNGRIIMLEAKINNNVDTNFEITDESIAQIKKLKKSICKMLSLLGYNGWKKPETSEMAHAIFAQIMDRTDRIMSARKWLKKRLEIQHHNLLDNEWLHSDMELLLIDMRRVDVAITNAEKIEKNLRDMAQQRKLAFAMVRDKTLGSNSPYACLPDEMLKDYIWPKYPFIDEDKQFRLKQLPPDRV